MFLNLRYIRLIIYKFYKNLYKYKKIYLYLFNSIIDDMKIKFIFLLMKHKFLQ